MGLPTLKSILRQLEIKSNSCQIKYANICNKLSYNDICGIFELFFEQILIDELVKRCGKHRSSWSREVVTAVLDDSIFKQWISNQEGLASYEKCYGRFFSGQYHKTVMGCKMLCFGLSIDGGFYPLYFSYCPKGEKAREIAVKLLNKWQLFWKKMRREYEIILPFIPLSCDNGYSHKSIEAACLGARLHYISVPKKSHLFEIGGKKWKLKNYIEQVILPLEKKSLSLIPIRVRAYYKALGKEVVLLFFRLKGSGKISVIYSTNLDIHAKTLRRHWFQRTYIEQFFKTLKHVLKIQNSITRTKIQFDLKLWRFSFSALEMQLLIRYIWKRSPFFKEKRFSFQILQRYLALDDRLLALIRSLF